MERDGRIDRDHNIRTAHFQLLQTETRKGKRFKFLKSLRKNPATMLQQSEYGWFAKHFLGEAPHSITAKHYAHEKYPLPLSHFFHVSPLSAVNVFPAVGAGRGLTLSPSIQYTSWIAASASQGCVSL